MRPAEQTAPALPLAAGSALATVAVALLALLGGFGAPRPAGAQSGAPDGVQVEARLGPRVVSPDGTVTFEIEVVGEGLQQPRLRPLFNLQNLEMVGGPNRSHSLQMGTGGITWRFSWSWYLRPRAVGEAAVTSIRVQVGDAEVELSSRRIQVAPGGSAGVGGGPGGPFGGRGGPPGRGRGRPRAGGPGGFGNQGWPGSPDGRGADRDGDDDEDDTPPVLLHAEVDPPTPYVGQRTLYTIYLYTRVRVRGYEATAVPSFDGCWARSVDLSKAAGEQVDLDGTPYLRVPIFRRALYPLRAGTVDLGSLRLRMLIERLERSDLFFGPVQVPDQVVEESNRVKLPVRALPPPTAAAAGSFHGTVGPLEVSAVLDRTEVAVGHGATLTVEVRGEGHLGAMRPPAFEVPAGLDLIGPQAAPVEPVQQTREVQDADPAAAGTGENRRAWSYVLVPRRVGTWTLPPVEITYFDPATARYSVASSSVPPLVAHEPGQRLAATAAAAGGAADDDSLHSIRSAALPGPTPRRWSRLLPWAFGIPWVLALALLAARRPGGPTPLSRLPVVRRLRRLLGPSNGHRQALARLRDAMDRAAAEDRPRRAAIGLERAWRDFLEEIAGVPEGVPVSGWCDALADRGVPPETCDRVAALLDDLHYLRFAPELSDIRSMTLDLAGRSDELAGELLDLGGLLPAADPTDPTDPTGLGGSAGTFGGDGRTASTEA